MKIKFCFGLLFFTAICTDIYAAEIEVRPIVTAEKRSLPTTCHEMLLPDPTRIVSVTSSNLIGLRYGPNSNPNDVAMTTIEILNLSNSVKTQTGRPLPLTIVDSKVHAIYSQGLSIGRYLGRQEGTDVQYFYGSTPTLLETSASPREGNIFINKGALLSWNSNSLESPPQVVAPVDYEHAPTMYLPQLRIFLTARSNVFLNPNGVAFTDQRLGELLYSGDNIDLPTEKVVTGVNLRDPYSQVAISPDGKYLIVVLKKNTSHGVEIGAINGKPKIIFPPENARESIVLRAIDLKTQKIIRDIDVDTTVVRKPVFHKNNVAFVATGVGLFRIDMNKSSITQESDILVHDKEYSMDWPTADQASVDQYSRVLVSPEEKYIVSVRDGRPAELTSDVLRSPIQVYKRDRNGNYTLHSVTPDNANCAYFERAANKILGHFLFILCSDRNDGYGNRRIAVLNLETLRFENIKAEPFKIQMWPRTFAIDPNDRVIYLTTSGQTPNSTGLSYSAPSEVVAFTLKIKNGLVKK